MAETRPALPLDVMEIGERAAQFARSSRAPATERAYQSDWSDFVGWCRQAGVVALPAAATVGAYLADRADSLRVATLRRQAAHPLNANSGRKANEIRDRAGRQPRGYGSPAWRNG
jgi:hypothetical protein